MSWASNGAQVVKNPPDLAEYMRDIGLIPGSGRLPWRRAWQPTLVFLSGESHGQRNLVGSVHGVAKSQTQLKWLSMHARTLICQNQFYSYYLVQFLRYSFKVLVLSWYKSGNKGYQKLHNFSQYKVGLLECPSATDSHNVRTQSETQF